MNAEDMIAYHPIISLAIFATGYNLGMTIFWYGFVKRIPLIYRIPLVGK